MSLLGLQRKLPMEMVTCPENPKHHILLCSKSHMSMKRVWSHNGNKQTIARKSVSFKSESCSGNLQFISLTLWQHHRDGAVWAEPDFIYFLKKKKERKKEGDSCAAAALSSVRRWAVLIQATQIRSGGVLQWQVSFAQTETQIKRRGSQESAPRKLADSGEKKWRACRPVTSWVYAASAGERKRESQH